MKSIYSNQLLAPIISDSWVYKNHTFMGIKLIPYRYINHIPFLMLKYYSRRLFPQPTLKHPPKKTPVNTHPIPSL